MDVIKAEKLIHNLDRFRFEFIFEHLHGPLREMYWKFGGRKELRDPEPKKITFEYLISLPGPKRAKILRANPIIREEYSRRTQSIITPVTVFKKVKTPSGMTRAVAIALGLVDK